ncbi:MAG: hypothetical protein NVS3B5_14200 [Sphingomicrobium sp.]
MTGRDLGLSEIYDRAPVILQPCDWHTWLTAPLADLARLDVAPTVESTQIEAMSTLVREATI